MNIFGLENIHRLLRKDVDEKHRKSLEVKDNLIRYMEPLRKKTDFYTMCEISPRKDLSQEEIAEYEKAKQAYAQAKADWMSAVAALKEFESREW